MNLTDKIKTTLAEDGGSISAWKIANAIYDNCMNTPHPSNGGRVAAIVKACNKSPDIGQAGTSWFLRVVDDHEKDDWDAKVSVHDI